MTMAHLTAQPGVPASAQRVRAVPPATRKPGLRGTLRSEFTKIRSVRSTWVTLAVFFAAALAFDILASQSGRSQTRGASFDPTALSVAGAIYVGELALVVIGALVITSEYGTRMIGTSLAAMPRRDVVYAAKAIVLMCVTFAAALVTSLTSFFAGQAILASTHAGASITSPGALRAVILAAAFVTSMALLAFGLGAVIRYSAGTISGLLGMIFVIPLIAANLPYNWSHDVARWVPGPDALSSIVATNRAGMPNHVFGPYGEVAVFAGYALIAMAAGALLFRRRDA
jgi:hypothetical protein